MLQAKFLNAKNLLILSFSFYIAWQIIHFFYGERVLAGNGSGWDGIQYAQWVSNFSLANYFQHQLSAYYIQRIVPSILVHYIILMLHLDRHYNITIINTFIVFNNILILICIIGLFKLARFLHWSAEATLVAFICFVFNFFILRMSYTPLSTDFAALTVGFLQIYTYIKRNVITLYFLSLIGAFIWPTLLFSGLFLILFEPVYFQRKIAVAASTIAPQGKKAAQSTLILLFIISCLILAFCYCSYLIMQALSSQHAFAEKALHSIPIIYQNYPRTSPIFWVISIFVVLLYLYYILLPVFKIFLQALNIAIKKPKFWIKFSICALTCLLIAVVIHQFSLHNIAEPSAVGFFAAFVVAGAAPGKFIISYFTYFGLASVLFILLYPKMNLDKISSLCAPFFLLLLVFGLQVHSRFGTPYFPMIAIILGSYLSTIKIKPSFCVSYFFLAFLFSYAWLPLNWPGQALNPTVADLYHWPWQVFFATQGLWTTNISYCIELILFGVATYILFRLLNREAINVKT